MCVKYRSLEKSIGTQQTPVLKCLQIRLEERIAPSRRKPIFLTFEPAKHELEPFSEGVYFLFRSDRQTAVCYPSQGCFTLGSVRYRETWLTRRCPIRSATIKKQPDPATLGTGKPGRTADLNASACGSDPPQAELRRPGATGPPASNLDQFPGPMVPGLLGPRPALLRSKQLARGPRHKPSAPREMPWAPVRSSVATSSSSNPLSALKGGTRGGNKHDAR